uniref:Charged multivesicular body protein 4b n=1 Tax=Solanum tuberosum TaxID=4113 RepID=M1A7U6_SOLTU
MPLNPSAMLDAQFNTIFESMKLLQESMRELQANNKRLWGFFDKVNSGVYSVNRVLLIGCSNGFPLLSVNDASDVCEVSSLTTAHKMFVDMLGRYKYAYSFNLDSTRLYTESESVIHIMDRITLVHKIKCLQLPFDPGVYVTHDVIFLCDMCKDIRSITHIEYLRISANHAVRAVSSSALEKYIDAYDFIQYFYFSNFNLSWKPYTTVASSHGDNSFTVFCEVAIGLGLLSSLLTNIAYFCDKPIARTVFGLGNPNWSCSNDINQRAGVNMNSGVSFVCDVLNDDPQSEKWYSSVFGPAPPTGLNHLQLSNGHSIVEWVDDCSVVVLWIIFASCIRLFYGLITLGYPVTTILKRSSHIFSDDKVSLTPGWFEQFNLKFQIPKFDHCWIQDGVMLDVLVKKAVLFTKIAPEVERAKDFLGEQNRRATIPYLRKQMLYEQQVDQLENFHLPLHDSMLLLEGANTISNTIIDDLGTTAAAREVTQKAPTIEDIDKIIVAISELMEIMKMLQEAIFSQI